MPAPHRIPVHDDPGLQPERSDLAWGRTTLSMIVSTASFLRWMPHHGWFAGTLVLTAGIAALAIHLSRRRRFHRAVRGISQGSMSPDIAGTAAVASSVAVLSILGIYAVLFLPIGL
ncbi:DUF202 domain-containing protein [Arthrobacter sp. MI7-26]|uniref:DUF202 domain-containing protein n=1 Tax=Arthrobacter sp. MI7-26 TaxID=2993653 RepID=UPI0022498C5F|nr:DUF202 domain-containing protein [Arthrobacter sp. MI7-26]MCX2746815.1 DUF202 domain-containing protein [Arthrobacter sp. MI7-26]